MRGRIVHYNPNEGKGLIAAEERQFAFGISEWCSEVAPAINQTVDFTWDEQNQITGLKLVDAQVMAKEKLNQFASTAGSQSQVAAVAIGQIRNRMGLAPMVVAAVLFAAWFFLPALTINNGFGYSRSFSISDVLGIQLNSSSAGSSFGFWAFLGLVAVAAPWAAPWLRARWASLLNLAPLAMLVIAFIRVRWQMHALVSQAIDAAGQFGGASAQSMMKDMVNQMGAELGKAVSFGIGFWVVLLLSLALAIVGLKRYFAHT